MQTKTMTVQQALNELKVLDSRVVTKVNNLGKETTAVQAEGKLLGTQNSRKSVTEFLEDAVSKLQSANDLINYRRALKSAVLQSNAVTKVTVAEKDMTVAEAIEYKNSISLEWNLVRSIENGIHNAEISVSQYNDGVERKLERNIDSILGNEKDRKSQDELEVIETLRANADKSKAEIAVPKVGKVDLVDYIANRREELEDFESNVDFILTASNVTTNITVEW